MKEGQTNRESKLINEWKTYRHRQCKWMKYRQTDSQNEWKTDSPNKWQTDRQTDIERIVNWQTDGWFLRWCSTSLLFFGTGPSDTALPARESAEGNPWKHLLRMWVHAQTRIPVSNRSDRRALSVTDLWHACEFYSTPARSATVTPSGRTVKSRWSKKKRNRPRWSGTSCTLHTRIQSVKQIVSPQQISLGFCMPMVE